MTTIHKPADSTDPAVHTAVDAALAGASVSADLRAVLVQLAQGLRAEHPADWEPRLRKLWKLALRAGEVWSPKDGVRGLEIMRSALAATEQPAHTASPVERVAALAAAQGAQPIEDPASLVFADWPEDESADDLIAAVREWRRETPPAP